MLRPHLIDLINKPRVGFRCDFSWEGFLKNNFYEKKKKQTYFVLVQCHPHPALLDTQWSCANFEALVSRFRNGKFFYEHFLQRIANQFSLELPSSNGTPWLDGGRSQANLLSCTSIRRGLREEKGWAEHCVDTWCLISQQRSTNKRREVEPGVV